MIQFDRRTALRTAATGFGWLAFQALHQSWARGDEASRTDPLAPKPTHLPARAKHVIFLFMEGGPSHLESFDHKPELARAAEGNDRYLAPVHRFARHGESGLPISDAFPHLAEQADHLCVLNGVTTKTPGHQQAIVSLHTGSENFVRPSMGAWITYGLGSEAEDLPGFVTVDPIGDKGGALNYGSAFLPATFQGTRIGSAARGLPNVRNLHLTDADQRRQLDFVQRANRRLLDRDPTQPEIEGLIRTYELAYRMQTSIPETLDLSREPAHVANLYGLDDPATSRFGTQCLIARRLVEAGVRFVQLTSNGWDHHNKMHESFPARAVSVDMPMAGLIADLAQRNLLDETLIVWGGEFGRTPHADNNGGRGHNAKGYSMWMAGGGTKGGFAYGATDELGGTAVEGRIGTHDLHATILHLLGLDHEQLTYRYAGRDFRLTDTAGTVAREIIA